MQAGYIGTGTILLIAMQNIPGSVAVVVLGTSKGITFVILQCESICKFKLFCSKPNDQQYRQDI